jgi:Flp pilus assembly CpaF family ATPase
VTATRYQIVVQETGDAEEAVYDVTDTVLRIGRDPQNEILLSSPFISRLHASIVFRDGRLWVRSEGLNPTIVNQREIARDQLVEVEAGDAIIVHGFTLRVREAERPRDEDAGVRARFTALVSRLHEAVVNRLDPRVYRFDSVRTPEGRQAALQVLHEELDAARLEDDAAVIAYAAREAVRATLLMAALGRASEGQPSDAFGNLHAFGELEQARLWVVSRVGAALALPLDGTAGKEGIRTLRDGFDAAYRASLGHVTPELAAHLAAWYVRKEVIDLVFGLGPLTDLLHMPDITEIMVVSKDQIYIEHGGTLEETGRTFLSDRVGEQILERILGPINRRIDRSSPMVDARLPDGSRVNAVIPPLALKGPCITIRRFSRDPLTIDDLVGNGALTSQVATFLRACVKGRKNIVISGGTGSGKTTLLNALSGWIPPSERIVTIEDTAELRLQQRHVVTLEARPPNIEQQGEVTIRDLVRNALRMRPDRIVVGECRGKEALDMLQAMNTGHEGSMTTGHANSPSDMLQRLEVMVLQAADIPLSAVRRQIVSGIDLIVQQTRERDGRRRVTSVTEVVGLDPDDGSVVTEDVFAATPGAPLAFTGYLPTFGDALIAAGHLDPAEVFWEES